ncbi:hypothetical protein [Corynebacterium halotolerans]|uniref:Low-density lipoprotein receptor YWTD repeat-containing protein n=1 Tax=Corynebacterium halotolerans YIM 70093 = DSM 44683 TaxID=1121362 RepID=M1MTU4_9CORY|nr:hypothetical protein [Corynebacterium halotolerans]AGF71114.1 low-density lipoprotein receptor YWTD repeat-containing protein [Corynebacterium halotolerans YIM 70093 = DSM 44683]
MSQLLALAWDQNKIALIDLPGGGRRIITTETGPHPDGVVSGGGTIYWTTMGEGVPADNPEGALYTAADGGVHAVDFDGGNRRDVVPPGQTITGKQLAIDSEDNLYWGNREGFALSTVRTDGTGLRDLVKRDGSGAERDWIVGVAVDDVNGHVYWTQKGSHEGGDGRIFRAGLEIPGGETAENRSDIELLWDDLPAPINLEYDDGQLFWTDRGHHTGGNSLNRAAVPAIGEKGQAPVILAEGFEEVVGLAVDKGQQVTYVADLSGKIWAVPSLDNTSIETHVALDMGFPLSGLYLVG